MCVLKMYVSDRLSDSFYCCLFTTTHSNVGTSCTGDSLFGRLQFSI